MSEQFSGYPKAIWSGNRNMELLEAFSYTDPDGKKWEAPAGSVINGATIPKALWSSIGSPFVGKYRRASVVHDIAVGEGTNPDPSLIERRRADKMFYHACRFDGCSKRFAAILYLGVSIGTWGNSLGGPFRRFQKMDDESVGESLEDQFLRKNFNRMIDRMGDDLDDMEFEDLESKVQGFLVF